MGAMGRKEPVFFPHGHVAQAHHDAVSWGTGEDIRGAVQLPRRTLLAGKLWPLVPIAAHGINRCAATPAAPLKRFGQLTAGSELWRKF